MTTYFDHDNPDTTEKLRQMAAGRQEWSDFVAGAANGHLLQTSEWGDFKSQTGWDASRVAIGSDQGIVAGALLLFRRLPLGQRLAYVPRGPVGPWWEPQVAAPLFAALHEEARRHGAFMLKIEPEARDGSTAISALAEAGFRLSEQTVQPRSTVWIDLSGDEEEIRARMKSKFRYNIGLASRKGIQVREGLADDVPAFSRLMDDTSERDGFSVHHSSYYQKVFDIFHPMGACTLLLATFEEQIVAGLMAFAWAGKAWYMYGASSNQERNRMPNHALQWEAIRWARQRGCQGYDLWGIPDEVGEDPDRYAHTVVDRSDGLWGVYRFKQGFGGEIVRYAGAYDYVYAPTRHRLYQLALKARRAGQITG